MTDEDFWRLSRIDKLRACRERRLGLSKALSILDTALMRSVNHKWKLELDGVRDFYGETLVKIPHLGNLIEAPAEQAGSLNRSVLLWPLRELIGPDVGAVLEIGAGQGELIVSLAAENRACPTKFIGTDITPRDVECIRILSDIACTDVEARVFDATAPNLDFLNEYANVVIFAHSVFNCLPQQATRAFFKRAAELPNLKALCVFDIMTMDMEKFPSVVLMNATMNYAQKTAIPEAIQDVKGRLEVTKYIPCLTGKRPGYPHAYFQLEPVRG
jgi:hypothetical protein